MDGIDAPEDEPIEAKMLTRLIESAQRKVEGNNFSIRKNVLQYDDVMNKQREVIYSEREKVLKGDDLSGDIASMTEDLIDDTVDFNVKVNDKHEKYIDYEGIYRFGRAAFDFDENFMDGHETASADELKRFMKEEAKEAYAQRWKNSAKKPSAKWNGWFFCASSTNAGWITSTPWINCDKGSA